MSQPTFVAAKNPRVMLMVTTFLVTTGQLGNLSAQGRAPVPFAPRIETAQSSPCGICGQLHGRRYTALAGRPSADKLQAA